MTFDGCRILLVEDEYLLAHDLQRELESVGAVVLGPEPSVKRAMGRIAREPRIDAAILDVNLGGEEVYSVADALAALQIPFLFSTGYHDHIVRKRFPDAIICAKPFETPSLFQALHALFGAQQKAQA